MDKADTQMKDKDDPVVQRDSFLHKLVGSQIKEDQKRFDNQFFKAQDMNDEVDNLVNHPFFIPVTSLEKNRLYQQWKHTVIVKLLGKRMSHITLKTKIQQLWKISGDINLVDLGSEFYLINLNCMENYNIALHNGPWFIGPHFLTVRQWEPKFQASDSAENYSSIWIRLHELPTEYYDADILQKIGGKVGTLLKVDNCTVQTLRGRSLLSDLGCTEVRHIYREANFVADLLSKHGCNNASCIPMVYFSLAPTFVMYELNLDSTSHLRERKGHFCISDQ